MPSLQAVPSLLLGEEHVPFVGLQVPALWHWSTALHTTGLVPEHVPLWQVSVWVQALPSLQVVPSVLFGEEHAPLDGSHVPALWHWSIGLQTTGLLPPQVPL